MSTSSAITVVSPEGAAIVELNPEGAGLGSLPHAASALIPYLLSEPGDAAQLCCVPALGAAFGDRWPTLATITVDAAARATTVSPGSPRDASSEKTIRLVSAR